MTKEYWPTRPTKKRCLLVVCLMLIFYFLDNSFIANVLGAQLHNAVFKPFLWLSLAFLIWFFPQMSPKGKLRHRSFLNWWAFNLALLLIGILILAGFIIDGFGNSPYDHSLQGSLLNILLIGSILIGSELVRNYLVNNLIEEENYLVFALIAILMTVIGFAVDKYTSLKGYEDSIKFFAQYFAPDFAKNLLATYLSFLGGPLPAIIYLGVIKGFHWFSPVLPNLKWLTAAFVGILGPLFSLNILQYLYSSEAKSRDKKNKEGPLGWMVTSAASILLIWFAVGVFPVYPSAIATGSMEPLIKPGDIIMVEKINKADDLKTGDIIQFQQGDIRISHRVIELVVKKGVTSFRTKGDNNTGPDKDLVKPEQIKGKVVKIVPKLGWPTLLIKSKQDIPMEKIQF